MRYVLTLIALFPFATLAQETTVKQQFITLLHGAIGVFGAISVAIFLYGFTIYLTRLGLERREEGIEIMQTPVTMMVVVMFAIGVLLYLQK